MKNTVLYLDCAATTPMEPEVLEVLIHYTQEEYGNEGSRTHEYGARAKQAVQKARDQVAQVLGATRDEVIFTSGATESNNLAVLGLAEEGRKQGRLHVITTAIEHKAILEPMERLSQMGFEVEYVPPTKQGRVSVEEINARLRPETWLVSVMHANNETGVIQPLDEICGLLSEHDAYLHVDAAQTFGKELDVLKSGRIDLISASAHKLYGPKGIGALIVRKRGYSRPPLTPLLVGGGQERGLRPGTLPVPLISAFGKACELAQKESDSRREACLKIRAQALEALSKIGVQVNGAAEYSLPHILNFSVLGLDSEAAIVALKGLVAVSNGSACTSANYSASHVLAAMKLTEERIESAIRLSWCHMTPVVPWDEIVFTLKSMT
jgi:cysteine desulfurase